MNRRDFLTASAMLLAAGGAMAGPPATHAEAIKQVISDYYQTFFRTLDKQKYRSLLTHDYLLLENGEIFDAEADIATMPAPDSGYTRSDAFDFRVIRVDGDTAYAVYFLRSDLTDRKEGPSHREWLESAILRREAGAWQIALLHSTKIAKPVA
jgi:ketosteroid isomerase-like protein